jgi:hypothetical protein
MTPPSPQRRRQVERRLPVSERISDERLAEMVHAQSCKIGGAEFNGMSWMADENRELRSALRELQQLRRAASPPAPQLVEKREPECACGHPYACGAAERAARQPAAQPSEPVMPPQPHHQECKCGACMSEARQCTCHPDDNPPRPCPRKYALSECQAAAQPSEAEEREYDRGWQDGRDDAWFAYTAGQKWRDFPELKRYTARLTEFALEVVEDENGGWCDYEHAIALLRSQPKPGLSSDAYQPRTGLGAKLLAIRERALAHGSISPDAQPDVDANICGDDGPITAEECALWLDRKYRRHHEAEDRAAAMWLRKMSAEVRELRQTIEIIDYESRDD